MSHPGLQAILKLSVAERLEIVEEIWDSIAEDPEAVSLTEEQREDLEQRLVEADEEPRAGTPWKDARERIRRRAR